MASIVQGYEYDIFISYRQKDNKHDGWVTEFVNNLKGELESTFKEEISVYFDINPHDGLLETHDVNASLKEKLKCLIFIPIISRTYCDPNSFAWEYEFRAFVEEASKDHFGLKIRLPNSNVANRVLPVRIHDLDNEDIKLCECILGGVLRGIEFIYKESGFNRPLKHDDDEKINLNKTKYRNQITKVALAIKEIILGLKGEPVLPLKETIQHDDSLRKVDVLDRRLEQVNPSKFYKRKLFSGVAITMILIIVAVLVYPKIFKRDKLADLRSSDGRISVAVMPFQNLTNDTIWNVWQDGIQDILITSLSNSEELKVRQRESVTSIFRSKGLTNYASITPSVASTVAQKLDANVFVYGSIKQAAAMIRVNAQLINAKTEAVSKSFQIDGTAQNILHIIDSLSVMVKNFLIISKLGNTIPREDKDIASTNSPEAFRFYIYGMDAFSKRDFPAAVKLLLQAIAIDSNFSSSINNLACAYMNQNLFEPAKKWSLNSYKKRDQMPMKEKMITNETYAYLFETPEEMIRSMKQLQEIDDQSSSWHQNLGGVYNSLGQYDKAIKEFEKTFEIHGNSKPYWVWNYTDLGFAYHRTNQYKKEEKLYQKAEKDFPDDPDLIFRQAILSLSEGDTIAANQYIKKYRSILKDNSSSESDILTGIAYIFTEADLLDKAEENYRKALIADHESLVRMNNLAYFLIDKDRHMEEGMTLIDKVLKLSPDNYSYLHSKGWGLYKKGKYKEALEVLGKSWDLRREKAVYDHTAFLHLEEAKRAFANQK